MKIRHWKLKILTIFFFYSLFSIFYSHPVNAQQKPTQILRISPIILNVSLSPGKTYEYEITLENLLDTPLPLQAVLDKLEETDNSPMISWTHIDQTDFIIPAHSKKNTNVTITIPKTVPIGGYYVMIFFQPVLTNFNNSPTEVQTKIGLPILANIGVAPSKGAKGEVTEFSFKNFLYEKPPLEYNLKVKNKSLYHFSAKPFLFLKPLFGKELKQEIEEKIILPNKTRSWEKSIQNISYGLYTATITVSTGGGDQIYHTSYFAVLPISLMIITILTMLSVSLLIIKRKNIKKALNNLLE